MPYKLSGACLVPTDDDTFYVMGGMTDENGAYEFLNYMLKYSVSSLLDHVRDSSSVLYLDLFISSQLSIP